ncbi:MAG TPA: 16S rRNA (cytosine(1402)-N(4))-methyltransferase RsmH [Methylomirabilota bacterium]|nr:16S rRNA (cytosine(1402)-N(4))-methyltransferase RsmH [Methylomirabilota bacterium]
MPEFFHKSVMLAEVLKALQPRDGGRFVDGTLGAGGHAAAILRASAPGGWLFGVDRDEAALEAARQTLAEFAGRFELRRGNFSALAEWVSHSSCDGVLLDLGVSSPQLDRAERGFSFMADGPLDMRMDQRQEVTAADLVNRESEFEIARIFWEFGDERRSRRFAKAIVEQRRVKPFTTTKQLAEFIERLAPRGGRKTHPATQVFQALRIAVNDELSSLKQGLDAAVRVLRPGGRLAVITFQSLEDRLVKEFGRERTRDYAFEGAIDVPELRKPRVPEMRWVQRKAIQPSAAEVKENPRSRSAQLRVLEKV